MRIPVLGLLTVLTVYMGYRATDTQLQWDLPRLLPDEDSTLLANQRVKELFGRQALTIIIASEDDPLKDVEFYNQWLRFGDELAQITNVDTVAAVNRLLTLRKNTEEKKFELKLIGGKPVNTKEELLEVSNQVRSLPFYKNRFYTDSTDISIMAVVLNTDAFNSPERYALMDSFEKVTKRFEAETGRELRYSGMPYIRDKQTNLIKSELTKFVVFAAVVTVIILIFFFRSFPPVFVSMLIVLMGVVWSLGIISVLNFKITVLSSMIPPLIIVIGIPNSVYLINKYHAEYAAHGNKVLALTRIIRKIGRATLMTNLTTAIGFSTFIFTQSEVLVEFGIVASINILLLFTLSIFLVPGILSFLKPPKERHTRHLDKPQLKRTVELLVKAVTTYRKQAYIITSILIVLGFYGITLIGTTGNLVDDLPRDSHVVKDLHFLEEHLGGVMPFEIIIDTKKPGRATHSSTLKKIDKLYKKIEGYDDLANPVSVVDGVKFLRQTFYGGNPSQYKLIAGREQTFIKPYLPKSGEGSSNLMSSFVDSTNQHARVSVRIRDIGTAEMTALIKKVRTDVNEIFNPEDYEVTFAGATLTYLKGTTYLVRNLFISLAMAIVIISLLMAALFSSFRMIAMSIFTNLIPLLLTAAIMGYFGIPIKPSTLLIFSIAFGISIDDTIHFLAKYRQELVAHNWNVRVAAIAAVRETGVSMIYTSIILLAGFSVFATSQFGGTQALGMLVSITLLIAMIANLVLLPSFLLSLDHSMTTKAFKEPLLEVWDEEEDIDLDSLEVENDTEQNPKNSEQ